MATIFPNSASVGQIFQGYTFNGTAWEIIGEDWKPVTYNDVAPDYAESGFIWVNSTEDVDPLDFSSLVTASATQILTNKYISGSSNFLSNIPQNAIEGLQDTLDNLDTLPLQNGNIGKFLSTDGSAAYWAEITGLQDFVTIQDVQSEISSTLSSSVSFGSDVNISGNLTVSGSTSYVNTQDLVVSDPMIYIGEDNQSDVVDLGFVSSFNDGTYQHAGFVRDATDGVWKLFNGVTDEPTSVINFEQATLDAIAVGSASIGNVTNQEIQYLSGLIGNIQDQLNAVGGVPTGTITMYGGTSIPSGWIACDGSAISRSTYSGLFSAISTSYGIGDGSTTFNLPDLRGRAPIGVGTGTGLTARNIGSTTGNETQTLTIANLPVHDHSIPMIWGTGWTGGNMGNAYSPTGNNPTTNGNTGDTGSGTAHNNMQPSLAVNFIIKT